MRKTILLALLAITVVAVGATPDKKKKKTKKTEAQTIVVAPLATSADTISYAAGQLGSLGLISHITHVYNVDTAYIADFIDGYMEASHSLDDPKYNARQTGTMIARMVAEKILPQTQKQFDATVHSIAPSQYNSGVIAGILNDTTVMTVEQAKALYNIETLKDKERMNAAYKAQNEEWLKTNATKEGVKTTASGLQYKILKEGNGPIPTAKDRVSVLYVGKLIDGTEFDRSGRRNSRTTTFGVNQVIKGWSEALTMMPVGSEWELYIPQELAYGASNMDVIKPYSTLIFKVTLVDIEKTDKAATKQTEATNSEKE